MFSSQVVCEYCRQLIESRLLNEHHASTNCPEYPVPCPNWCMNGDRRNILSRSQLPDHLANTCPLTTQQCPYLHLGCVQAPARQDLQEHLDNSTPLHLDMVSTSSICFGLFVCKVSHNLKKELLIYSTTHMSM